MTVGDLKLILNEYQNDVEIRIETELFQFEKFTENNIEITSDRKLKPLFLNFVVVLEG